MDNRTSALNSVYQAGHFGLAGHIGITLKLIPNLSLQQVAAWPDTVNSVTKALGVNPNPGVSDGNSKKTILKIDSLKWWLIGHPLVSIEPSDGVSLDLSHSRTRVRISGPKASELLSKVIPIDLREQSFPVNTVASTMLHHVGILVWRNELGYELLIPRGFAVSVWEIVLKSSMQYGVQVE